MSKLSDAKHSLIGAAKGAGGSFLTRDARMGTMERVAEVLYSKGFQISGADGLKERHIATYIQSRQEEGVGTRTLQNEMAHIRGAMRAVGRDQAAASSTISNKALGIAGGSRAGTKVAATEKQYREALTKAAALDRGLAASIQLERTLGLRAAEAIQSPKSLATWERALEAGRSVTVVYGTKGGRPRDSAPADSAQALAAVREARAVAEERGGKLLDAANLKQAMQTYHNAMHREIRMQGHSLRYAYACDRVDSYVAAGYSRAEAYALTSMDLGHGDGRGRYVQRVYTRR